MELERLYTVSSLAHEIAVLFADVIVDKARELRTIPPDKTSAEAVRKERTRVKKSDDWLDRLIAERMALDAEREQQNRE